MEILAPCRVEQDISGVISDISQKNKIKCHFFDAGMKSGHNY